MHFPYNRRAPMRRTRNNLVAMPAERLVAIIGGIFLGLIAASLLTLPLSTLPSPFRQIVPIASAILLCYLSVVILSLRQGDLRDVKSFAAVVRIVHVSSRLSPSPCHDSHRPAIAKGRSSCIRM